MSTRRSLRAPACLALLLALQGCQLTIPNGLLNQLGKPTAVDGKGDAGKGDADKPGAKEPGKDPATPGDPGMKTKPKPEPGVVEPQPGVVGIAKKPVRPPIADAGDCKSAFVRLDRDQDGYLSPEEVMASGLGGGTSYGCAEPGVISNNGGTIVAAGGGNLVAMGGGNLIAASGDNMVRSDAGGGLIAQNGAGQVLISDHGMIDRPDVDCAAPDPGAGMRKFDFDGDGRLSFDEFCEFWGNYAVSPLPIDPPMPPEEGCKEGFGRADLNQDGRVTFDEFMQADYQLGVSANDGREEMMMARPAVMPSKDELYQRFKNRDRNADAAIDPGEWCGEAYPIEPYPMPVPGECGELLQWDQNGDRRVDWGEFMAWKTKETGITPDSPKYPYWKEDVYNHFKGQDANGDGFIATDEACGTPEPQPYPYPEKPMPEPMPMPPTGADCSTKFANWDGSRDKTLQWEEYFRGRRGEIQFIKAPTPEEEARMKEGYYADFKRLDRNGDGKLGYDEFLATCGG